MYINSGKSHRCNLIVSFLFLGSRLNDFVQLSSAELKTKIVGNIDLHTNDNKLNTYIENFANALANSVHLYLKFNVADLHRRNGSNTVV